MTERQKLIAKIINEIRANDDWESECYYGALQEKYNDLNYYFNKYHLTNPYDRISIAQKGMNFDIVKEEMKKLNIESKQKKKLSTITKNNDEWYETLNFEILDEKYDFLNDILDLIITDIDIQQRLISLDDKELNLFKLLYSKLKENTSYMIPYISRILMSIKRTPFAIGQSLSNYKGDPLSSRSEMFKYFSNLIADENILDADEIEKLLFLFSNNMFDLVVTNYNDFKTLESYLQNYADKLFDSNDLIDIKNALLIRSYGISYDYAVALMKKYKISNINVTEKNYMYLTMLESIIRIVSENDITLLKQSYNEIKENFDFKMDYMTTTLLESGLRKIYAKQLNDSTYKPNTLYGEYNGVKFFDAGTNFKMIVTSVGAYQSKFEENLNYKNYWNSKKIRSHGNCCSLIANNNLSTAKISNVCFGFTSFNENMLLISGAFDLNSTPLSRKFNTFDENAYVSFMSPDDLINNTRTDYNELVFERRDLSSNPKFYKKNPDYIVYFEEFDDMDITSITDADTIQLLQEQQRILQESMKAASEFNIPIVKVNREKCAKNSIETINKLLDKYAKRFDPILINKIIVEFENNRIGLRNPHSLLRETYFSKEKMNEIIIRILSLINSIEDIPLKKENINMLKYSIVEEKRKFDSSTNSRRKYKQTPALNFDNVLEMVEQLEEGSYENKLSTGEYGI